MAIFSLRTPGRLIIAVAMLAVTASQAGAQELSKAEREKRHTVNRMVELMAIGKYDCQNASASEWNSTREKLRAANPEFFRLLEASVYFRQAQATAAADQSAQAPEPGKCEFALGMFKALLEPEGQKEMHKYRTLLAK